MNTAKPNNVNKWRVNEKKSPITEYTVSFNVQGEVMHEYKKYTQICELKINNTISLSCKILSHIEKKIKSGKLLYLTILFDGTEFIQINEWDKTLFSDYSELNNVICNDFMTIQSTKDYYYVKCNNNELELEKIDNKSTVQLRSVGNIQDISWSEVNHINPSIITEKSMINIMGMLKMITNSIKT